MPLWKLGLSVKINKVELPIRCQNSKLLVSVSISASLCYLSLILFWKCVWSLNWVLLFLLINGTMIIWMKSSKTMKGHKKPVFFAIWRMTKWKGVALSKLKTHCCCRKLYFFAVRFFSLSVFFNNFWQF